MEEDLKRVLVGLANGNGGYVEIEVDDGDETSDP